MVFEIFAFKLKNSPKSSFLTIFKESIFRLLIEKVLSQEHIIIKTTIRKTVGHKKYAVRLTSDEFLLLYFPKTLLIKGNASHGFNHFFLVIFQHPCFWHQNQYIARNNTTEETLKNYK